MSSSKNLALFISSSSKRTSSNNKIGSLPVFSLNILASAILNKREANLIWPVEPVTTKGPFSSLTVNLSRWIPDVVVSSLISLSWVSFKCSIIEETSFNSSQEDLY